MAEATAPTLSARLLREARERAGLTLDELAARSGISKSYLSRVERGERTPSLSTQLAVAHAIGRAQAQRRAEVVS